MLREADSLGHLSLGGKQEVRGWGESELPRAEKVNGKCEHSGIHCRVIERRLSVTRGGQAGMLKDGLENAGIDESYQYLKREEPRMVAQR